MCSSCIILLYSLYICIVARAPLLRARCDGDHSVNIRGFRDYASESILFDYKATFVFVAVHSSAVLTMEVIQSMELAARVLGKVRGPQTLVPCIHCE